VDEYVVEQSRALPVSQSVAAARAPEHVICARARGGPFATAVPSLSPAVTSHGTPDGHHGARLDPMPRAPKGLPLRSVKDKTPDVDLDQIRFGLASHAETPLKLRSCMPMCVHTPWLLPRSPERDHQPNYER
jgi:hypothetical protein